MTSVIVLGGSSVNRRTVGMGAGAAVTDESNESEINRAMIIAFIDVVQIGIHDGRAEAIRSGNAGSSDVIRHRNERAAL